MPASIDLVEFGFKDIHTIGSMAAGSNQISVAANSGLRVGDQIIVEVGGEAGEGMRGTVGVGGVYAAVTTDPNLYYTNTMAPKALVAKITGISADGTTLTLDKSAAVATTNAQIHYDNLPAWNKAVNSTNAAGVTVEIPAGSFAVSDELKIWQKTGWTVDGAGKDATELFSPDGARSATMFVWQSNGTTISDFELRGNAKLNGYGLDQYNGYAPGIYFRYSNDSVARDLTVTDVFQKAIGVDNGNNVWAYNVDAHLTEGLARYVQWQFQWSNSTGGGAVDSSVNSAALTAGFEAFLSQDVSFIRTTSHNAVMAMNSAGNFYVEDATFTFDADAWQNNLQFHVYTPIININSNFAPNDPNMVRGGTIVNAQMYQEGYLNDAGDVLKGIVINSGNPNVTIVGGSYEAPDGVSTSMSRGPLGIDSTGKGTFVDGFTVIGVNNPGTDNIYVADGVVQHSTAGRIGVATPYTVASGAVAEDGRITASGTVAVKGGFQTPGDLVGAYGTFAFNAATGQWSYALNNASARVQSLAAGERTHDVLAVKSADGTTSRMIDVVITGTNDAAVISGTSTGALTEDAASGTTGGDLDVSDADDGQAGFQTPASLDGTYGVFSFNAATGVWGYALDNARAATQALAAGQQVHDILTVTALDGAASRIINVAITGADDTAVISGKSTGAVTEDAATGAAGGDLDVSNAGGQSGFQTPASLDGTYGLFSFNAATGVWGYALDNARAATQALVAGQQVHDTLTVTALDGTASRIIDVAITGANDVAVISGKSTGAVTEDAASGAAGGDLDVSDADGQAGFQTPASLNGTYGLFSFNATTGVWGYALDNGRAATQALAAGEQVHDTLTVTALDGTASRIIDVAITGANDAAVISGKSTGAVTEDAASGTAGGDLDVSDADGQAGFQTPASLNGTYGLFSFNATTGVWGYALDNGRAATQALAAGEQVHDTLTVTSLDGTAERTIVVSVYGANETTATIDGTSRNDLLYGGAGDDHMFGGAGNDVLVGIGGRNHMYGGAGDDILIAGDGAGSVIDGGAGSNVLWGGNGDDYIVGGELVDAIIAGAGSDDIFANAGDDAIHAGAGTDYIFGGAGNDVIHTDLGNDPYRDFIYVGGGTGVDTIMDFTAGDGAEADVLVIALGNGVSDFAQARAAMTQVGMYTVLTLSSGDQVHFYNVVPSQITADNFMFM